MGYRSPRVDQSRSGSAYAYSRPSVSLDPTTASRGGSPGTTPLLGGSQSGATLAFVLDPLARRPFDLIARVTGSTGFDQHDSEAALGVRWRLLSAISLGAERLIALGPGRRHDWTLRLAGGRGIRIGPLAVDGYGETGIVGIVHPTLFAAAQARGALPIAITSALTLAPGVGIRAGVQHDRRATTSRVDAGPSLRLHWARASLPVDVALNYRRRLAGNAAPGSGVALTVSTRF